MTMALGGAPPQPGSGHLGGGENPTLGMLGTAHERECLADGAAGDQTASDPRIIPGVKRHGSRDGAPGETRTHGLQVRNLTLYPLSYGRALRLAEREGFEPSEQVTPLGGLANRCTRPLCDLSAARAIIASGAGRNGSVSVTRQLAANG
jgi:hypothetical protein